MARPRRTSSVRVQMADDEAELLRAEDILAAQHPRQPGPDDPPPLPADVPDEGGDEDPDEIPIPDENGGIADPDDEETTEDEDAEGEEEPRPADPQGTAAATRAGTAGAVPEEFAPLPRTVRYESRITIVDAYQYPGSLIHAPDWVDRNWAAYADNYDAIRNMEPGPALRVPTYRGDTVLCRKGDYVARQEVKLLADQPGEIKLEVWEQDAFERLFIPVKPGAPEHIRPWDPSPHIEAMANA